MASHRNTKTWYLFMIGSPTKALDGKTQKIICKDSDDEEEEEDEDEKIDDNKKENN